ncbi:beta family protein [Methylobacterium sp. 13MFTsu3.1M2]|uniref:beta family protein n=1 Tax=Methylobacterium sp. 13MFTsu3.1M2 TaxID=1502776 RepID=UPI0008E8BAF2|nr:beta family protein [Methylobacterium sp. 13MFTsu3.1M2]SFD70201.1 Beta protein [Methylobacterium sp. 13MFTsu3.1M2]
MNLFDDSYVPSLRWRQGEYQALLRLAPSIKDRVVPLITIPPVEFDFELWKPKKSIHEHVYPFVSRYKSKWGLRPAWIALDPEIAAGRMNDGSHIFDFIFAGLRPKNHLAVPAVPLAADVATMDATSRAVAKDGQGAAVLLRIEDLMIGNPRKSIETFAANLDMSLDELDVIVDLRAPNFEPYAAFAKALVAALKRLGNLYEVRTIALLATAIPDSFANIAKGSDEIPRHDWLFFKTFIGMLPPDMRRPVYGDHTIVHPDFKAMDMRKIKAAGKIIYTTPESWATRKGGAFRDDPAQMHNHCKRVMAEPPFAFQGAAFSYGDKYIADCAAMVESPSNLSRWKDVCINHHITMATNDLATLYATP